MKNLPLKEIGGLLTETYQAWTADKAPRLGAALAYYTVFSLAPLLLVAVGVASLFLGDVAARGELARQLEGTLGGPAASAIQEMLQGTNRGGDAPTWWASLLGLGAVLLGAGALFGQLQDALNTIWKVEPKPGEGIVAVIKGRILSFSMVLVIGFLLLVSMIMSTLLVAFSDWILLHFGSIAGMANLLNLLLSFGMTTLLFMAIYKVLPDTDVQWKEVWAGALLTSFLFTVGKYALGLYLGRQGLESAYGGAGSLVILLLWVYYAAQILFFGAEFTKVWATRRRSELGRIPAVLMGTAPGGFGGPGVGAELQGQEAPSKIAAPSAWEDNLARLTGQKATAAQVSRDNRDHLLAVIAGGALVLLWVFTRRDRS